MKLLTWKMHNMHADVSLWHMSQSSQNWRNVKPWQKCILSIRGALLSASRLAFNMFDELTALQALLILQPA